MSGAGWGELGGPTVLTPLPPRARNRHHRRSADGNALFGVLLTGANVLGMGLVATLLVTTDADAAVPAASPATAVPDLPRVEAQPARTGANATTVTVHASSSLHGVPARTAHRQTASPTPLWGWPCRARSVTHS